MNVTDLVDPAGAGSTDWWVRSSNMNQLISRKNSGMPRLDEVDWTNLGWQSRRVINGTQTHDKDSTRKGGSKIDTIIGVVCVGALVVFMLAYLT
jgi:hypothetical protein